MNLYNLQSIKHIKLHIYKTRHLITDLNNLHQRLLTLSQQQFEISTAATPARISSVNKNTLKDKQVVDDQSLHKTLDHISTSETFTQLTLSHNTPSQYWNNSLYSKTIFLLAQATCFLTPSSYCDNTDPIPTFEALVGNTKILKFSIFRIAERRPGSKECVFLGISPYNFVGLPCPSGVSQRCCYCGKIRNELPVKTHYTNE